MPWNRDNLYKKVKPFICIYYIKNNKIINKKNKL